MSYRAISIIIPQNPNFIDGTVEGTDVTQYAASDSNQNRTYYGKGCPNVWDNSKASEGYGGSPVSCSVSTVKTSDNEYQMVGTLYTYRAANSGSGNDQLADNNNSPDTFCPLGWQLPYSGTGGVYYDQSKSWNYMFSFYDINVSESGSANARSYPVSFIYSGYFLNGGLSGVGSGNVSWTITKYNLNRAYRFILTRTRAVPNDVEGIVSLQTVRCFYDFSILSSTARWQEQMSNNIKMTGLLVIIRTMEMDVIIQLIGKTLPHIVDPLFPVNLVQFRHSIMRRN